MPPKRAPIELQTMTKERAFQCVIKQTKKTEAELEDEFNLIWEKGLERNKRIAAKLKDKKEKKVADGMLNDHAQSAYDRSIRIIGEAQVPIFSGKQAMIYPLQIKDKIHFIGDSIAKTIDELLKADSEVKPTSEAKPTSEVKPSSEAKPNGDPLTIFKSIYGMNRQKAMDLVDAGYASIEEIPLSILDEAQKAGVKYYKDLSLPFGDDLQDIVTYISGVLGGNYKHFAKVDNVLTFIAVKTTKPSLLPKIERVAAFLEDGELFTTTLIPVKGIMRNVVFMWSKMV